MTPALLNAMHGVEVLKTVTRRLEDGGGVVGLGQLERLSVDELTILVRRERGMS